MVPPESLSQYLSNEYHVMGFQYNRKITNIFFIWILVKKVALRPERVKPKSTSSNQEIMANPWTKGSIGDKHPEFPLLFR
jgi:hypothetical protein